MTVSLCQNLKTSKIIRNESIYEIISGIRTGSYSKEKVELARSYGKGTPEYNAIKETVYTFTPNGSFFFSRRLRNLQKLSGFIYLDLDENIDPNYLKKCPFIYSCWRSFSGIGVGALAKVNGLTTNNFNETWMGINFFLEQYDIKIDPSCKDITRQNVISFDPDIYINESCTPFDATEVSEDNSSLTTSFYPNSSYFSLNISTTEIPQNNASTPSITNPYCLKRNTYLADYKEKEYVVIKEGKPSRTCYVPKKVKEGKRHLWLSGYIRSILFNNMDIPKELLLNELLRINKNNCIPSLEPKEVCALVNWYFNLHINNKLDYKPRLKRIWFPLECTYTLSKKRSVVGIETGIIRKENTISKLIKIYKRLKDINGKVTQKMVLQDKDCDVAIRTIRKYWKEVIVERDLKEALYK